MLSTLQNTILRVTLGLEAVVLLFSFIYAAAFSRRIHRLMASMRIIQNGDYTHKVDMGGNDELTLLGHEFNDLTDRLQTSEQKRRRFVSDASHELKTPLASIKLLTDSILQNEMDTDTIREFVGDIGDEADRLNRMTAKLLSLTRVDGDENAECEIIYMEPTVRRAVRRLSTLSRNSGISSGSKNVRSFSGTSGSFTSGTGHFASRSADETRPHAFMTVFSETSASSALMTFCQLVTRAG